MHLVATAACKPELVLNALNHLVLDSANLRRWARHGSTRYLSTSAAVSAAIHHVVREQGDAMAVFEMPAAR